MCGQAGVRIYRLSVRCAGSVVLRVEVWSYGSLIHTDCVCVCEVRGSLIQIVCVCVKGLTHAYRLCVCFPPIHQYRSLLNGTEITENNWLYLTAVNLITLVSCSLSFPLSSSFKHLFLSLIFFLIYMFYSVIHLGIFV